MGGCVRDFLRHKKPHDIDFATPLTPQEVIEVLSKANIPRFETGIRHGTITAVLNHTPYEITSLRSDGKSDGRHSEVVFGVDYKTDALRRDFTMNALYMDGTGRIFDYVAGQKDIAQKKIRFIGNAQERIKEDYLRMLRYFRFVSKLGIDEPDDEAFNACRELAEGIRRISVERIRDEFMRILEGKYVISALRLMAACKLLPVLLSKADIGALERFLSFYPIANGLERLVVLTADCPPDNWKWSRVQKKYLSACCRPVFGVQNTAQARHFLWKEGRRAFLFHLAKARLHKPFPLTRYYALQRLKTPDFPVNGKDFFLLGFRGNEIQKLLACAEQKWVKMNFSHKKRLVIQSVLRYNRKRLL